MMPPSATSKGQSWDLAELLAAGVSFFCTLVAVTAVVVTVAFVLVRGLPAVSLDFLLRYPEEMGRKGGILPSIVGTLALTGLSVAVAAPLGIGTAVYLAEYASESSFTKAVRFGIETLSGIPSIIFGLFGFLTFVVRLGLGWSILSGALTLSAMLLPTVVRTAEEALRAVPQIYREVSLSLGASRWQTTVSVVIPQALRGIVTGLILAVGRAMGETAAVIFTAGSSLRFPGSLLDPVRTLAVHFYILAREGISTANAYGTAAVLLLAVMAINLTAYVLMSRAFPKGGSRR